MNALISTAAKHYSDIVLTKMTHLSIVSWHKARSEISGYFDKHVNSNRYTKCSKAIAAIIMLAKIIHFVFY